MRGSLRVGTVGGVRVGVHWSLLAVVLLIGVGLASNRLPLDAPGHSRLAYDLVGGATAIGLMAAVLAHELGHAVLGRRAGMQVRDITLSWMGGITRLEGESRSPGWEAAVAAVGPAISAALGAALLAVRALPGPLGHGLAGSALGWLGVINLTLAVFNLVPASPLDGGRVLHGVLWRLTGDRWRATRLTSRAGVGFGAVVVAVGCWAFATGRGGPQGLLVGLLGWWMLGTARAEGQLGVVQRALDGRTVAEVMRPVGAAPGWITVQAFIDGYDSVRPGWVWLLEGWGGTCGYQAVVAGEAVRALPPQRWGMARPLDVATPVADVAGARPGEGALAALARTGGARIILVVDGGHTVGAVLPSDIEAMTAAGARRPGARYPVGAARQGGAP